MGGCSTCADDSFELVQVVFTAGFRLNVANWYNLLSVTNHPAQANRGTIPRWAAVYHSNVVELFYDRVVYLM